MLSARRTVAGLAATLLVACLPAQAQTYAPGFTAPVITENRAVSPDSCAPHERGRLVYTGAGRRITIPRNYSDWVRASARANRVPETLLFSLIWHESGFCQKAVSSAGAIGLGQLMPGTARDLGVNPHHAQQNIAGAARYLRQQYVRFGRADLALAAYNAGPGRVAACGCVPNIPETQRYVSNIVRMYRSFN